MNGTQENQMSEFARSVIAPIGINQSEHEEWRDVVGYEGLYRISNYGRVFSSKRIGNRKDRILVLLRRSNGNYRGVDLHKDGICKKQTVHRMVATAFIDNPNGYNEVNHKDGIPSNNHVNNLEWVSRSQNMLHAYAIGLKTNLGELNSNHTLTEREVKFIRYIRGLYPDVKTIDIAKFYSLAPDHIRSIFRFEAWEVRDEQR
jgi:hypothetical protein